MRCKYYRQDFGARIHGGVALYDGEPVFLVETETDDIEIRTFPQNKRLGLIKANDQKLDISSPSLGYINSSNGAIYCYRKPERRYKQTLTPSSVSYFIPLHRNKTIYFDDLFMSKEFSEMLRNNYPSFEKSFNEVVNAKTGCSVAFHRDIALVSDSFGIIHVFFKVEEVGIIKPGENIVRVPKSEHAWVVSKYLNDFNWCVE